MTETEISMELQRVYGIQGFLVISSVFPWEVGEIVNECYFRGIPTEAKGKIIGESSIAEFNAQRTHFGDPPQRQEDCAPFWYRVVAE